MPLISPPNDYGIPQPEFLEDKPVRPSRSDAENRRIELFLNVNPWLCPECGTKMFGRCKECVYCRIRHSKHTPRPADYKKHG